MKPEDIALNELCMFEFYIPQSDKPILADLSLPLEEGGAPFDARTKEQSSQAHKPIGNMVSASRKKDKRRI